MVTTSTIAVIDLLAGVLASLGLLYLLYSGSTRVHYRRFFRLIAVGMLIYSVTGPIIGTLAPAVIHAVHTVAVLFIIFGLYDLINSTADHTITFEAAFRTDAPPDPAQPDTTSSEPPPSEEQ